MAPKPASVFYAVRKGYNPGVYSSWTECEFQIKGYTGAKYKKLPTMALAEDYVQGIEHAMATPVAPEQNCDAEGSSSSVRDEQPGWDVVYSDGACKRNGRPDSIAGVGVWWGPNDSRNIAERCPGDQTNNRAELIAILRVLEETPITKKPLKIKTDSQYCRDCFEKYMASWKRNGWRTAKKESVKNVGIIRLIDLHFTRRRKFGQRVVFEYVKGHSGDVGNDGADYQANLGTLLPPAPERDWALEEELLASSPLPEVAEEPLTLPPATRKRSRSPTRMPSTSRAAASPPRRASSKGRADRLAAIEAALRSGPSDGDGPPKKRVKTPPPDAHFAPESSHRAGNRPTGRVTPSKYSAGRASRIAMLEAAMEPTSIAVGAPTSRVAPNSTNETKAPNILKASNETEVYPVRVIYALPPLVPVQKEEIDMNDYADCLLSDDELLNEI